jgi:homoserine kinase
MAKKLTSRSRFYMKISVPATTANLGSGFDCLGAALNLFNHFEVSLADQTTITIAGTERDRIDGNKSNLFYQSIAYLFNYIDRPIPDIAIGIDLQIPLARGLGSSATAIVGGLVAGNELAGKPLPDREVLDLAIAMEGHPDNVVPAFLGGCQLTVKVDDSWEICPIPWHPDITAILGVPNFELSTEEARSVLPKTLTYPETIFNIGHFGLLIRALQDNNPDWLQGALDDRIHQPYRQSLIKGYTEVKTAAEQAGAYGLVISGAGPTLLALSHRDRTGDVIKGMTHAWAQVGVKSQVQVLDLVDTGVTVEP